MLPSFLPSFRSASTDFDTFLFVPLFIQSLAALGAKVVSDAAECTRSSSFPLPSSPPTHADSLLFASEPPQTSSPPKSLERKSSFKPSPSFLPSSTRSGSPTQSRLGSFSVRFSRSLSSPSCSLSVPFARLEKKKKTHSHPSFSLFGLSSDAEPPYLLSDPANERKLKMTLALVLQRAAVHKPKGGLLAGKTFWVTRSVETSFDVMKRLIESAGGEVSFRVVSFFSFRRVESSWLTLTSSLLLLASEQPDRQNHPTSINLHRLAGYEIPHLVHEGQGSVETCSFSFLSGFSSFSSSLDR